ncbi:hypothetical protein [Micromonospora nigra]|uniref:hypothetical protein n=1 Tax=Micromonospora nigra TaxID=145857 RepID=UPI000B826632|nr:hypothetical protein [Micromonospora nigra]
MGQQRGEFGCASRMVMTAPENSYDGVLSEVGVAGPVLRGEAGAGGVVEDGAELVVFVAWCGGVVVDDESGEELPVGSARTRVLVGWTWKPSSRAMSVTGAIRSWVRRVVRSPERADPNTQHRTIRAHALARMES